MAATDPQEVVFWDEDAGVRLFFSGHWYRFVKKIEEKGIPTRWAYVPEAPSRRTEPLEQRVKRVLHIMHANKIDMNSLLNIDEVAGRFAHELAATGGVPDSVYWIVGTKVGNNDEFGVEVNGVPYFYYKWPDAAPDGDLVRDTDYRYITKREFGEVIRKEKT